MTKYVNDLPEHDNLWRHEEVLDNDLERLEHDKNFESNDVYNSILDDEPAFHSLMNFPEEDDERMHAESDEDSQDNVFDDRDAYKNADNDDMYYFI